MAADLIPVFIVFAIAGHFGLRLTLYNRLNALGLARRRIKRTERVMFAETWLTPAAIAWGCGSGIRSVFVGEASWQSLPTPLVAYATVCVISGAVFGFLWLLWRPIFRVQHAGAVRQVRVMDLSQSSGAPLPRTPKCEWASRIPGNQIFDLSVEHIDLPVPGLPTDLSGYRIAHLSDIHLTGQVDPRYAATAVQQATAWRPDLIALTGDIVDKPIGLTWIDEIFSPADALDGCHFILGNHDTRISPPDDVRAAMSAAGWHDLGGKAVDVRLRNTSVTLIGNESPWFTRPSDEAMASTSGAARICLSHTPDQFDWCRRHHVELMLAGHTHGGQGRLPLAGPILSPSWHGSRWSSGDFVRSPTTMHVSRGLGGVHLLRLNCRPELSLLTLRPTQA